MKGQLKHDHLVALLPFSQCTNLVFWQIALQRLSVEINYVNCNNKLNTFNQAA